MLVVASVPALTQFLTVDCSDLYPGIMTTECVVDEDGFITLPDVTEAPYTVTGNPVVVQEGNPVIGVDRHSSGVVQYDNAASEQLCESVRPLGSDVPIGPPYLAMRVSTTSSRSESWRFRKRRMR